MLFLIIFILSLLSGFILPWWVVAIIAFIAAWFKGKTSGKSFGAGFLAVGLAWAILALIRSIPNENELARRVAILFGLPGWWFLMVLITAIIGGLVGGMATWSGMLFKKAFAKTKKR
jgi:hypothetical protein